MQNELNYLNLSDLTAIAFKRLKQSISDDIDNFLDREEKKHIFNLIIDFVKITIGIVAPTIYILTVASDLDKWKTAVLVLLAFMYGIFKVGMLSLKFFKELLVVITEWREKKIKIEGVHYVYIILILVFLLLTLLLILIFMLYSHAS